MGAERTMSRFLQNVSHLRHDLGLGAFEYVTLEAIAAFWLATAIEFRLPNCFFLSGMILPPLMIADPHDVDDMYIVDTASQDYLERFVPDINGLSAQTDYIYVPVNVDMNHWVFVEIHCRASTCVIYDSLPNGLLTAEKLQKFLNPWIAAYASVAGVNVQLNSARFARSLWTQQDGSSCGIATCMNMFHVASNVYHGTYTPVNGALSLRRVGMFRRKLEAAIRNRVEFAASSIMPT